MIYATGETHGNFQRFAPEHFPEQAGNGHDCFQSRSPWTAPLKEGATQMISADFQSVPIITGEATLPLRWLPPATPLWTCCPRTPCATSCSRSASFTIGRYTFLKR